MFFPVKSIYTKIASYSDVLETFWEAADFPLKTVKLIIRDLCISVT